MNQLNVTTDAAKQTDADHRAPRSTWSRTRFGTILYQYPDIVGYDSTKVTDVSTIPLSPRRVLQLLGVEAR